jgi:hypothetical protein
LGTLPFFLGSYPKAKPRPPGLLGGFGKLPEDVFRQSRGFQSTLTNFGSGRVGFGVRGASHNYFFLMVSQTGLKNKTFLWWTTFLISQRRPSYTCLKNLIEKFEKLAMFKLFSKIKLFPNFLVLPQTRPQTKTFLWWTIFLISQRRPSYTCLKILKKKLKNWLCSNFFQKFNLFPNFLVLPQTRPQTKTLVWWTFFLISQRCPSYTCLNKDVLKFSKSSFTLLRLVLRQPFPPNFETSIWLRKKQPGWKKKTLIFYPSFFHDFIKKTSKQWYFVKTEVENNQRWQSWKKDVNFIHFEIFMFS